MTFFGPPPGVVIRKPRQHRLCYDGSYRLDVGPGWEQAESQ